MSHQHTEVQPIDLCPHFKAGAYTLSGHVKFAFLHQFQIISFRRFAISLESYHRSCLQQMCNDFVLIVNSYCRKRSTESEIGIVLTTPVREEDHSICESIAKLFHEYILIVKAADTLNPFEHTMCSFSDFFDHTNMWCSLVTKIVFSPFAHNMDKLSFVDG